MKCAIMQPTYLPWPGYFSLIDYVDKFVILDDVKLEKHSWHVRNKIKTSNGELYLTVPIHTPKGRLHTKINEALINTRIDWKTKHLRSLYVSYKRSNFFTKVYPFIEKLIAFDTDNLSEFTINLIRNVADAIGIKKEFIISSTLKGTNETKDERLVSICKIIGCNIYISPVGSASYIERSKPGGAFPENNIRLYYQNYESPVYKQLFPPFIPYLSTVDLLFNCGFKDALAIVINGRKKYYEYLDYRRKFLKIKD